MVLLLPTVSEGQYWQRIKTVPAPYNNNYWLDVYFLPSNPQYGWICGFNGMVVRTTDGGNSWSGTYVVGANHLESVFFPSTTIGYTSGSEGIFKSTDGGASWTNITPNGAIGLWGNYFLDNNNGVVIGNGCGDSQSFYRTTDGGTTWNLFQGSEPNSGLTDALLYPSGLGWASSSGRIWRTLDSGATWSVFSTTGSEVWQEEMTSLNSSFLVPYAGIECTGGGQAGGMRFSTNNGATWNSFSTGEPMFGAFLSSPTSGWACGYNRALYYTNDGGLTWADKSCGIEPGNLDDMWFVDANTAWAVGEGVYKLSPPTQIATKNALPFIETCIDEPRFDSLYVKNFSNSFVSATYFLTGANSAEFSVVQPTLQTFSIGTCDSQLVVVKFSPVSKGNKIANLRIAVQLGPEFNIALSGFGNLSTAKISDTLLIIDPAPCGVKSGKNLKWTASEIDEWVQAIQYVSGSKDFTIIGNIPMKIPALGADIKFEITPRDTGWYSARFKVQLLPCYRDTFITLRAYGVSPIINTVLKKESLVSCSSTLIDTIPVCNTGNSDLIIKTASIIDPLSGFYVKSWASGQNAPVSIPPGKCDSVYVEFKPNQPQISSTKLRLDNNDATTARGTRTPIEVLLKGTILSTKLTPRDTSFDFGDVCLNDTAKKSFFIANYGNISAYIIRPQNRLVNEFRSIFGSGNYPVGINANDSGLCEIQFMPKAIRKYSDTIFLVSSACDDTIKIRVTGNVIYSSLSSIPNSINGLVFTSQVTTKVINVFNDGIIDLNIEKLDFIDVPVDWIITFKPDLPYNLKSGDSVKFSIDFLAQSDTVLDSKLCITALGLCPTVNCIPVRLTSSSRSIEVKPDFLDFGTTYCHPKTLVDSLLILNSGVISDTIIKAEISPSTSNFKLLNSLTLPYEMTSGQSIKIAVQFASLSPLPETAELIIESSNMNGRELRIPLQGKFEFSDTIPQTLISSFDTIETCLPKIEKLLWIHNHGNITDTLTIVKPANEYGFTLFKEPNTAPNAEVIINPYDSSLFKVTCEPSLFKSNGSFSANYKLLSKICGVEHSIIAETQVIEPTLSYEPPFLNFGSIWKNDSLDKKLKIYNSFSVPQKLNSIAFRNNIFRIINLPAFPYTINPNDTLNLIVRFNALSAGNFEDSLIFATESDCFDTTTIALSALVPAEIYKAKIFIDDYTVSPGESITMSVKLDSALPRVNVEEINFEIAFDKWLFLPSEVFRTENEKFSFTYSNGLLAGKISGNSIANIFEKSGDLFFVKGMTFASYPETTELAIAKFDVVSDKVLDLNMENGSLTVTPVCRSTAAHHFQIITKYNLAVTNEIIFNKRVDFSIDKIPSDVCRIKLNDILGNVVFEKDICSPKNVNSIDISDVSSGFYMIEFSVGSGVVFRGKIVVAN